MSWPTRPAPDHGGAVVCALRGWTAVSVPASIPRCNDASNATIEPRIEAVERKQSKAQELLYERFIDRAQGGAHRPWNCLDGTILRPQALL